MSDLDAIEARFRAALERIASEAEPLALRAAEAEARAGELEGEVTRLRDQVAAQTAAAQAAQADETAGLQGELENARQAAQAAQGELSAAQAALEAEKAAHAQLGLRVATLREKQDEISGRLEIRLGELQQRLTQQETETLRLRQSNDTLRDTLRELREAAAANIADGDNINRALAIELEATLAAQAADRSELDAVLAELTPIIEEKADV